MIHCRLEISTSKYLMIRKYNICTVYTYSFRKTNYKTKYVSNRLPFTRCSWRLGKDQNRYSIYN